jgi:hypothetical protein
MDWWPAFRSHVDANWVDLGTLITAVLFGLLRHFRCRPPKRFFDKQTRKDFLDGTALFPLIILALSATSSELVTSLLQAQRLILSIAGVVALMAILEV